MNTIGRLTLVALLGTSLMACSRTGALCSMNDKACCSEDEVEDEDGECVAPEDEHEPLPTPDGEFGFGATITGATAFEGRDVILQVYKAGTAWCGRGTVENGTAELGTTSEVVAGGIHYWVYWGVDVNDDGYASAIDGEPTWSALVETNQTGDTHVDLSAAAPTASEFVTCS